MIAPTRWLRPDTLPDDGPAWLRIDAASGALGVTGVAVPHSVYPGRWVWRDSCAPVEGVITGWAPITAEAGPPPPLSEATVSCPGAEPPPTRFAVIRGRHECAAPGCRAQVDLRRLMCKHHWFALPDRLRAAVWRTYRPGQETRGGVTNEYVEAVRAAQDYLRGHR